MAVYCWNCGKEMDDELLFCPHCAMKQADLSEPKPRRKVPMLPVICAAVCIVALLTMVLLLFVPDGGIPAEEPADPYSVALPDPASFLNTQYDRDDVSAYTHYVTLSLKKSVGKEAVQEYLKLLQKSKYQLVLDDSWDYSQSKVLCTDYIFHYTGKGEGIKWVSHKDGYKYHVKLTVFEDPKKDTVGITLYTSPGFRLEDPGVDAKSVK